MTLYAVADVVPGESSTGNNSTTLDVTVDHVIFGDLNADNRVNILDMLRLRNLLGADAAENPEADLNSDAIINILDLLHLRSELR